MDIKELLRQQGLSEEEITAIVGNEKTAKAMSALASKYEEGITAKQLAEAEKLETQQYWAEKTQQLQGSVERLTAAERRAAEAEATAAQRTAYLKSLKEQGYDVPDAVIGAASTTTTPATPNYLSREDFEKGSRKTGADLVSLTKLSNEYRYLYGKEYLDIDNDFAEAQRAGKPLTEYARQKHGFDAKRKELEAAADQKRIDAIVEEKFKAREQELMTKYGSNPDTRSPMPSKFDKLQKQPNFKSDSWKSQEGRQANREERLKRFENISIQ